MTRHRAINFALTAALAIGIAAILSTGHHLDDHSADWGASTALKDAQQQAQRQARQDRAAHQLCIRIAGPGVAPAWDQFRNLYSLPGNAAMHAVMDECRRISARRVNAGELCLWLPRMEGGAA